MNKLKLALVVGISAILGVGAAAPAMATETCVPSDAWVEHIPHEAVGEPTLTIDNPDYVPAVPDTTTIVHHEGTPDVTTVTGYMKWTWNGSYKGEPQAAPPADGWNQVGITSDTKGSTPDTILHQGNGHGSYFYFETVTETTPGDPAWDETVVTPGTPAIGEPTLVIDNPDYKAAWVEDVNHDAVTCPCPPTDEPTTPPTDEPTTPPTDTPSTPATPTDTNTTPASTTTGTVQETVKTQQVSNDTVGTNELAHTGSNLVLVPILSIVVLVLLGGGGLLLWFSKRRKINQQ